MDTRTDAADAGGSTEWAPPGMPIAPASANVLGSAVTASGPDTPAAAGGHTPPAARPARAQSAPRNEVARWARICAIVSVVFNPLLLVSIAAIVLGIIGLHRSEQPHFAGRFDSGRRQATTGIGIGVFGLIVGITVPALFIAWTVSRLP
ncbi:DUF4190 domain-containing protein [Herbiconiux ginsengi]|uniref:DUF4190 domain-containing protein n=1 Tax=Herbiconiux ginsengi TaxID=381665 RepID=A0A1H3KU53_9MICO|nr:DUF4190 domain-containing protein [Herbiconiux ginsengi]SDY55651.1 hypothetical protein SAMN05216554_0697 [Herbiconiux ginsengi]